MALSSTKQMIARSRGGESRHGTVAALAVVIALCLAACTPSPSGNSTASATPKPVPSVTPDPSASIVNWQLWIQGDPTLEVATGLTKSAVVLQRFADSDGVVALDIVQPDSTWTLKLAPGNFNQAPVFAGDWPILAESNDASGDYVIRAHHPDGAERELYRSTGQDAIWIDYTAAGDTFYYAQVADNRQCLDSVTFTGDEVGEPQREWCPDSGTSLTHLWAGGEGSTSFLARRDTDDCAAVYVHSGTETSKVEMPSGSCPDIAVATHDLALWTEQPPLDDSGAADWSRAPVAALAHGERTDLGVALGGALTICDGAAVWLVTPPATESKVDEVYRWRPGDAKPTLIYQGELLANGYQATSTAGPECVDGTIAIQRRGDETGVQVLTERPMGWKLGQ